MKITKIETFPISVPLKEKYESHAGPHMTPHIIVKVYTDEGITGFGESAEPFARTWRQTPWSVKSAINNYFSHVLMRMNPFDIEKITKAMDQSLTENNMAKDAVTTALYDIMGKALRAPIHKLIGGSSVRKIPIAWCIGYCTIEEAVNRAVEYIEKGVKAVKIKLMDHLGKRVDLKKIKTVRHAIGSEISIRVDANGTYPSIKTLKKLEKYDLDIIEQPANELKGMRKYVEALETPVLADECVQGVEDAVNIIEHNAADIIAVKDYQVGGIYRAKQILSILKAFNTPYYLEATIRTGIGTAATLQLVGSVTTIPGCFYGCFPGPLLVKEPLIKEPILFENGYLEVPSRPGLGVEVDEEKLKEMTTTI